MKKIITSILCAGILLTGCAGKSNKTKEQSKNDGVECAVFEGWPVLHDPEFEIEAVFIPLDELDQHWPGKKVFIDSAGFIVEFPARYMDGNRILTDTIGLQRVVIHDRIYPNKIVRK